MKYTLEYSVKVALVKRDYYWIAGSWLALLVWAYVQSSYTLLIPPLVVTILVLLPVPGFLKKTIDIVVSDDALSIHSSEAVLWTTALRDITSIELEERGVFPHGVRKAMIIRNSQDDSYYLSLNGGSFGKRDVSEVIRDLNAMWKNSS